MASVDTLGDRLDWIIAERGLGSLRRLSLAAGLSHATLSNAINRERRGEDPNLSSATLAAVAKVADVPVDWLVNGGSLPGQAARNRTVEYTDRYAHAPDVIKALIDDGYDPRAVRRAVGDIAFDEGQEGTGALDLYRMAKKVLDLEAGGVELGVRKVEDDEL